MLKTARSYVHWSGQNTGTWTDRQRDRQTNRWTHRYHLAITAVCNASNADALQKSVKSGQNYSQLYTSTFLWLTVYLLTVTVWYQTVRSTVTLESPARTNFPLTCPNSPQGKFFPVKNRWYIVSQSAAVHLHVVSQMTRLYDVVNRNIYIIAIFFLTLESAFYMFCLFMSWSDIELVATYRITKRVIQPLLITHLN